MLSKPARLHVKGQHLRHGLFFPKRITKKTLYILPQTTSVEICGAHISQGNKKLGCACTILDKHPPQELCPLFVNFIANLLKTLKAFKDIIPHKGKSKVRVVDPKQGFSYRELWAAAQVLWIGEEFITYSQNLYKELLKELVNFDCYVYYALITWLKKHQITHEDKCNEPQWPLTNDMLLPTREMHNTSMVKHWGIL